MASYPTGPTLPGGRRFAARGAEPHDADKAARLLRSLLPPGTCVEAVPIADFCDALHPRELDIVANAVAKRRHEFSSGRWCAHRSLAALGADRPVIARGDGGYPVARDDISLTISHAAGLAIAAAMRRGAVCAIGIDVEAIKPLSAELARQIATPDEYAGLSQVGLDEAASPVAAFSAKEAMFKAVFSATGLRPASHELVIRVRDATRLGARFVGPTLRIGYRELTVNGMIATLGERVFATSAITQDNPTPRCAA